MHNARYQFYWCWFKIYSCSGHWILELNYGSVMAFSVNKPLGDTILLLLTCWQNEC